MTDRTKVQFVPRGEPGSVRVVLPSEVYATILRYTRIRLPGEAMGVLLGFHGAALRGGYTESFTITEAVPVDFVDHGGVLTPVGLDWRELLTRLEKAPDTAPERLGYFYSDPGIGLFPGRFDLRDAQRALAPGAGLLLLLNPSSQHIGFYLLDEKGLTPTGGFFEETDGPLAPPLVRGEVGIPEVERWARLPLVGAAAGALSSTPVAADSIPAGEAAAPAPVSVTFSRPPGVRPNGGVRTANSASLTATAQAAGPTLALATVPSPGVARRSANPAGRRPAMLVAIAVVLVGLLATAATFASFGGDAGRAANGVPSPTAFAQALGLVATATTQPTSTPPAADTATPETVPSSTPTTIPTVEPTVAVEVAAPAPTPEPSATPEPVATATSARPTATPTARRAPTRTPTTRPRTATPRPRTATPRPTATRPGPTATSAPPGSTALPSATATRQPTSQPAATATQVRPPTATSIVPTATSVPQPTVTPVPPRPTSTSPPTFTPVPPPTDTPVPTATRQPIDTPVPTATRHPIDTPRPTPTP